MDKSRDKHAKALRRKAKKQAVAKAATGDPWKNAPIDDGQFTCAMAGELELDGQCFVVVLRKLPAGTYSLASFEIDRGVIGLRDASGFARSSLAEFNDELAQHREDGLPIVPIAPAAARDLIAGAARYAEEFGFRLPADWTRWAGLLGGVGDWRAADTARFRPEYAESLAYAQRRLVGMTAEAFFAQPDITFMLPEGEVLPPDLDAGVADIADVPQPTPLDEWTEPTGEEYAQAYRLSLRRSQSLLEATRSDMAELGLSPGEGFENDATAAATALYCLAAYGRPPAELAGDLDPNPAFGDLHYFYLQIQRQILGRTELSSDALNVLRANVHVLGRPLPPL